MEIRELVAGGADQLVALFAAVLPGSPTAHVGRLDEPEAFLRDSHSFAHGAYVDGVPVGLAWGVQMRSPSGGSRPTSTSWMSMKTGGDRVSGQPSSPKQ